jgi:hypothetical protein
MINMNRRSRMWAKIKASEPTAPLNAPQEPKPGTNAKNQFR